MADLIWVGLAFLIDEVIQVDLVQFWKIQVRYVWDLWEM
jgi:hypothetical protein